MLSQLFPGMLQRAARSARRLAAPAVFLVGAACVCNDAAAQATTSCRGDCDAGAVTIDEILTSVNIALDNAAIDQCRAVDVNGDGQVTIDELVAAVSQALTGCAPTLPRHPPEPVLRR